MKKNYRRLPNYITGLLCGTLLFGAACMVEDENGLDGNYDHNVNQVLVPGSTLSVGLNTNLTIQRDEGPRTFDVFIPLGTQSGAALVLDLHPLTSTKEAQRGATRMDQLAAQTREFIVVWPQGYENSWNAGECCFDAVWDDIDDVGFLTAVIEFIEDNAAINSGRIYSMGYSNGASMSHRLAYTRPDYIAAIATNAFHLTSEQRDEAEDLRHQDPSLDVPKPVLSIHGYNDQIVCWQDICPNSIIEPLDWLGLPSAFQQGKRGWKRWSQLNNCSGGYTTLARKSWWDWNHTDYKWKKAYLNCDGGVEVRQILNSRNHSGEWLAKHGFDFQYEYNREIWDFLKRWSL